MTEFEKILREAGLSDYAPVLTDNRIDLDVLGHITDDHLKEIGIPVGDRIRLRNLARSDQSYAQIRQPNDQADAIVSGTSEIRQITVLFADLVGSTELATSVDVEENHNVLASFRKRCSEIIRANGGLPARFIGDAVLACFGFPHANENDATQAVQAAEHIAKEVPKIHVGIDYTLHARVGVATGLAMTGDLLGEGQESFGPATGATLNLAARLQALAAPDTVLIDQATRRLLSTHAPCEFMGTQELKGFAESQPIWRLDGDAQSTASAELILHNDVVPLIGRAPELATLERHWQESERKGSFVLVAGEAGIGKTRTVNEFVTRAGIPKNRVLRMECGKNEQLRPLQPIIALLGSLLGGEVSDPQSRSERLTNWVVGKMKLSPKTAKVLTHLIGVDPDAATDMSGSPRERKIQLFETLTLLIDRLGINGPNLFVIEDIHWVDPTTQEFLDYLVARVASMKAVFVCTYRPEHVPDFIGQPRVSLISLSRLDNEQSAELMVSVLQEHALPPDVASEIVTRADGIPFFIEELAKSAVETGLDEQTQSAGKRIRSLPTTLHGSLLARLDRVPGVSQVAPVGAAIGRTFSRDLLLEVSGVNKEKAQHILDGLAATGLLKRHGDGPTTAYTFKHALVWDAAHETMPQSRRTSVHRQIAEVLEAQRSEYAVSPETLARHFAEAKENLKACKYWCQAAVAAQNAASSIEAVSHFKSALDANEETASGLEKRRREIEIRTELYVPLQVANWGSKEILHNMERLRELRAEEGLGDELLDILHALSGYHIIQGEVSAARTYAEEIMAQYSSSDPVAKVLGLRSLGFCSFLAGEFDDAIEQLREAIHLCKDSDEKRIKKFYQPDTTLICRGLIAWTYAFQGRLDAMEQEIQIALPQVEERPRKWTRSYALTLIASAYQVVGDADRCLEHSRIALKYAEEVESEYWIGWNEALLGWAAVKLYDDEHGVDRIRAGRERYSATGSAQCLRYLSYLLAEAQFLVGDVEGSAQTLSAFSELQPVQVQYAAAEVASLSALIVKNAGND